MSRAHSLPLPSRATMVVIAPSPRSARRKTVSTSTSAAQQVPEIQFAAKKRALSGGQPGLPRSILKPYNFNGGNDSANGSTGILGRADQSTGSVGSRKSSGRRLTFATEANIRCVRSGTSHHHVHF